MGLDPGETAAICLELKLNIHAILMDEPRGRLGPSLGSIGSYLHFIFLARPALGAPNATGEPPPATDGGLETA